MKILIANANQELIKEWAPKVKFEPSTKNTSIFKISPKSFQRMKSKAQERGFNPYALFYW